MGQLHTSYHEAGHVVAALRFGQVVTEVSIIPEGKTDGRTTLGPASARWLEDSEEAVVYLLAGWEGEGMAKSTDAFLPGSRIDTRNPVDMSRGAADDVTKAEALLRKLHPQHDEEEIDSLFEEHLETARTVIGENERVLGHIAAELRQKKILPQADVEKWRPLIRERGSAAGVYN